MLQELDVDVGDALIEIPKSWKEIVENCLTALIEMCQENIEIYSVQKIGNKLSIIYDISGYQGMRDYVNEEIHYANGEIKRLEAGKPDKDKETGYGTCDICKHEFIASALRQFKNKTYCRKCVMEESPPKLVILKRKNTYVANRHKINIKSLKVEDLLCCGWSPVKRTVYTAGHAAGVEVMLFKWRGEKKCRFFQKNQEELYPLQWVSCSWQIACPLTA